MTVRRALTAVAACAVAVYLLALSGGFVGDDGHIIANNPLVHSASGVIHAFGAPYWPPAFGGALYRPLAVASYAVDWVVSAGSPAWFHAVNALWHAVASVLVGLIAARWVGGDDPALGTRAALAAGLVFAVHPVHVEAVANIVGRAELMGTCFTLLAVYAAVERDSWVLSALAWAAGLLCKENAVAAPGLILAAWAAGVGVRPAPRRLMAFAASWLVVGSAYALLRHTVLGPYASLWTPAPVFLGQSGLTVRLTAVAAFTDVARLLLFPVTLRVDYSPAERTAVTGVSDPRFLAGLAVALAAAMLLAWAWRRGRRVEALGMAWVGIAFLPVANLLFPIGVLIAERTLYLPSAGVALVAGALAARAPARLGYGLAFAAVMAAGATRSVLRIPVWRDNVTFARSMLRDSPDSYQGQMAAAGIYLEHGRPDLSLPAARRAVAIYPLEPRSYLIGAHAAMKMGQWLVADSLLAGAAAHCRPCAGVYGAEIAEARSLGDGVVADSLAAHLTRGRP